MLSLEKRFWNGLTPVNRRRAEPYMTEGRSTERRACSVCDLQSQSGAHACLPELLYTGQIVLARANKGSWGYFLAIYTGHFPETEYFTVITKTRAAHAC